MSSTTARQPGAAGPPPYPILQALHEEPDLCHVLLPPGIGEFLWVYSKLKNLPVPIRYWFTSHEPRRAHQICDMLGVPWGYAGEIWTDWLLDEFPGEVALHDLRPGTFHFMHINRHLERGEYIEDWMPQLPYSNPMGAYVALRNPREHVVLHMCSASYSEGNLEPAQWAEIMAAIEWNVGPVSIVGALWDAGFAMDVLHHYRPSGLLLLGRPFEEVAGYIADAQAFIGLNSGLAIMAAYLGVPTLEGYPTWLTKLAEAWPTADIRQNHEWCLVPDLRTVFDKFLGVISLEHAQA